MFSYSWLVLVIFMKNLVFLLGVMIFSWSSLLQAQAEIVYDAERQVIYLPALPAVDEAFLPREDETAEERFLRQRDVISRYSSRQNLKHIRDGMTEWKRAQIAYEVIQYLRQDGPITIERVYNPKRQGPNVGDNEYVVKGQRSGTAVSAPLLFYKNIDQQFHHLLYLLGIGGSAPEQVSQVR